MKTLTMPLDKAQLVLDSGKVWIIAKDDKLPSGYKAQIRDPQNLAAVMTAFEANYPELQPIPDVATLPRFISYPNMFLGLGRGELSVSNNFAEKAHLHLHGKPGGGKTVLAKSLVYSFLSAQEDFRAYVLTERPDEYSVLSTLFPKRLMVLGGDGAIFASMLGNMERNIAIVVDKQGWKESELTEHLRDRLHHDIRTGRSLRRHVIIVSQSRHLGLLDDSNMRGLLTPIEVGERGTGIANYDGIDFRVAVPIIT